MMPMMLIFCTVNLVFVSAAMSSAKATTINSSSQIIAVDMIPYSSITFLLLIFSFREGMLLLY